LALEKQGKMKLLAQSFLNYQFMFWGSL